jgi:uracil DNA glycosylase
MEKKLIYDDFEPLFGQWAEKFKPFIESPEMYNIYQKLKQDAATERIVPTSNNTFRAWRFSNPKNIKVVAYMMDPYPRLYKDKNPQATGIALDCSNSPDKTLQPSLTKFYDAISLDLGRKVEYSPSLNYLVEQGVLLLNTDLTCKKDKTGSHQGLWEPFQKYFLQEIMGGYPGIIYVLCGKESKRMRKYIYEMGNYVFELEHPAAAEHTRRAWNHDGIFNKINKILENNTGIADRIFWDKKDWDEELPF